jgi:hypothetical protein
VKFFEAVNELERRWEGREDSIINPTKEELELLKIKTWVEVWGSGGLEADGGLQEYHRGASNGKTRFRVY